MRAVEFCSLLGILVAVSGCGSAPVHAVFISSEKNVWVEDVNNSGLHYCMASPDGFKHDPVCIPARRLERGEKLSSGSTPAPASVVVPVPASSPTSTGK